MHEYIARPVYDVGVHLFFASLVWFAAWTLTSMMRGTATAKYWIWVATSLNFVLPLGAVLDYSTKACNAFALGSGAGHLPPSYLGLSFAPLTSPESVPIFSWSLSDISSRSTQKSSTDMGVSI